MTRSDGTGAQRVRLNHSSVCSLSMMLTFSAAQGNPKARERLEELKKGGGRMQKSNMDRAKFNGKQADGECVLM